MTLPVMFSVLLLALKIDYSLAFNIASNLFVPNYNLYPQTWRVNPSGFLGYNQFSTCFFVNLNSFTSPPQQAPLLSYLAGDTLTSEIRFQLEYERQKSVLLVGKRAGLFFPAFPSVNSWTHLCVTWDGSIGQAQIYIDGQLIGTKQYVQTGYRIPSNGYLVLGHPGFKGALTQVHFWDRLLCTKEVTQVQNCEGYGNLFNGKFSSRGRFGYGKVSNAIAPCEEDHTTEQTEETTVATTEEPAITTPSSCLKYLETSPLDLEQVEEQDGVLVSGRLQTEESLPDMKEFTICVWIYSQTGELHQPPFEFFDPGVVTAVPQDNLQYFKLYIEFAPTFVDLWVGRDYVTIPELKLKAATWQHLCFAWSGIDGGALQVFLDGELFKELNNLNPGYVLPGNGTLVLKQIQLKPLDKQNPTDGFAFKVAHFNWWNRVLTRHEVGEIYRCSETVEGRVVKWENAKWNVTTKQNCLMARFVTALDLTSGFEDGKPKLVKATTMNSLAEIKEITFCSFVMTKEQLMTPFTYLYLTDEQDKEVFSFSYFGNGVIIKVGDSENFFPLLFAWLTQICVTWSSKSGLLELFSVGELYRNISDVATGVTIPANGRLTLQKAQYNPMNHSAFLDGEIYGLMSFFMWDSVLTHDQIGRLALCNSETPANIASLLRTKWNIAVSEYCPKHPEVARYDKYSKSGTQKAGLNIKTPVNSTQFTVSFWYYCDKPDLAPIQVIDTGFTITFELTKATLKFKRSTKDVDIPVVQKKWTHFCLTWTGETGGSAEFFVDGNSVARIPDFAQGLSLTAKKFIVTQGSHSGPSKTNFRGDFWFRVTDVNLWDQVLTKDEVAELIRCYGRIVGNIINRETFEFKARKIKKR